MEKALVKLKELTHRIHPLSAEEWEKLASVWKPFKAKRKEILTAQGETENYLYFIEEGVQRVYYFDDKEREATIVLTYPGSFGGVLDSFMLQNPSAYYFETLTTSSFLRAPYNELQELSLHFRGIELMLRQGLAHSLSGVLVRMAELQSYSSEEKFRTLLLRSPHILQLVPQKYLANYLGIDATNFSKFINSIKI